MKSLGYKLAPRETHKQISNRDLVNELARVWRILGHRPSKTEWETSDTVYSYATYKRRFGGWLNACAALAEASINDETKPISKPMSKSDTNSRISKERKRDVPLKLRLKIIQRDDYRCVLCGHSPAIERGNPLEVDHIVPFAKGGETIERNLRTLCKKCNRGRGAESALGRTA